MPSNSKKNKHSVIFAPLAFALICTLGTAAALAQEIPGGGHGPGGNGGMRGGAGGGVDKSGDVALQDMIAELVPKFQLLSFEDTQTGTIMQYYLFVPEEENRHITCNETVVLCSPVRVFR